MTSMDTAGRDAASTVNPAGLVGAGVAAGWTLTRRGSRH